MSSVLRNGPTVCAVENSYCIMVPVKCPAIMSIKVGEQTYYNHANGIKISDTPVQRFTVPMSVLDAEKKYTVCCKPVIERLAYSCTYGKSEEHTYRFRPLTKTENINIYHLSDTHGMYRQAVEAGSWFGKKVDLVILNGDIAPDSESENAIFLNYDIAFDITKGECPCIITRGNHDLRGAFAEKLDCLLPSSDGKTYYRINFPGITFTMLDCGEDKVDGHVEYSDTVCCHQFRLEETEYLRGLYNEDYVPEKKIRVLLSHVPFCHAALKPDGSKSEFSIEDDIYTEWCNISNRFYRPHFFLAGHIHQTKVFGPKSKYNDRKINTPVITGGKPVRRGRRLVDVVGSAITVSKTGATVRFTNSKKQIISQTEIKFTEE